MLNTLLTSSAKKDTKTKAPAKKEEVHCCCKQQEKTPEPMPQPGALLRENGILLLVDKFDQEKIMPLVAAIYEYNLMPEEMQPEQITLVINSPGGSVHSAFHLIDAMRCQKSL